MWNNNYEEKSSSTEITDALCKLASQVQTPDDDARKEQEIFILEKDDARKEQEHNLFRTIHSSCDMIARQRRMKKSKWKRKS